MDLELCKEWNKNKKSRDTKITNPLTNKKIDRHGPTAQKLNISCMDFGLGKRRSRERSSEERSSEERSSEERSSGEREDNTVYNYNPGFDWLSNDNYYQESPWSGGQMVPQIQVQEPRQRQKILSPTRSSGTFIENNKAFHVQKSIDESIDYRIKKKNIITDYFKEVVSTDSSLCFSKSNIHKYINNIEIIKKGNFGYVYAGVVNNIYEIALKEKPISKEVYNESQKEHFPKEILWNHLTNELLEKKKCPNFLFSYYTIFCGRTLLSNSPYMFTLMELADSTIDKVKEEKVFYKNALFQLLYAIHALHKNFGLVHNNITAKNIMIKFNNSYHKKNHWAFNINEIIYYLPNLGFTLYLTDFRDAMSQGTLYSKGNLGIRNAQVVHTQQGLEFRPFTTKYYPEIAKSNDRKHLSSSNLIPENIDIYEIDSPSLSDDSGTVNKFWKNFNSYPSIRVDLDDFEQFPTYDMYLDIQSALSIFAKSKPMKEFLSKHLVSLKINSPWKKVELFLANSMIHELFDKYTQMPQDSTLLESYDSGGHADLRNLARVRTGVVETRRGLEEGGQQTNNDVVIDIGNIEQQQYNTQQLHNVPLYNVPPPQLYNVRRPPPPLPPLPIPQYVQQQYRNPPPQIPSIQQIEQQREQQQNLQYKLYLKREREQQQLKERQQEKQYQMMQQRLQQQRQKEHQQMSEYQRLKQLEQQRLQQRKEQQRQYENQQRQQRQQRQQQRQYENQQEQNLINF